jgi:hypothetical protein
VSSVARDGTAAAFEEGRRNKLGSLCTRDAHLIIIFYYFVTFLLLSFELEFYVFWLRFSVFLLLLELRFCGFLFIAISLPCSSAAAFLVLVCNLCVLTSVALLGGFFFFELQFGVVIDELAR